jgi:AcrR family transcriptional regulator
MIGVASRLLAEEGPQAVTVRRVTTKMGASTMAVYTCFGDMGSLVREIARGGYTGLAEELDRVAWSDDPVADLALLCRTYRDAALANPHLYAVMFGGRAPAGFRLTDEDRRLGQHAVGRMAECAARCVVTGRFRDTVAAHHLWLAVHGRVLLEIGGYVGAPADSFEHQLVSLMVGAGDGFEQATASVRRAAARFAVV